MAMEERCAAEEIEVQGVRVIGPAVALPAGRGVDPAVIESVQSLGVVGDRPLRAFERRNDPAMPGDGGDETDDGGKHPKDRMLPVRGDGVTCTGHGQERSDAKETDERLPAFERPQRLAPGCKSARVFSLGSRLNRRSVFEHCFPIVRIK